MSEEQESPWWDGEGEGPAEEPGGGEDLFSKLDADGDGVVTRDEFENAMGQGATLSGEVGTIPVDDASVLGAPGEMGSPGGMSDSAWFATGLVGAPVAIVVLSFSLNAAGDATNFGIFYALGTLIWPVGVIFGSVWGFVSGHQSFAWGLLASIVVIPTVLLGLVIGFCLVMIGSGGNF